MKTIISKLIALAALSVFTFTSCTMNNEEEQMAPNAKLEVRLNYASSAPFDAVNLDIEGVFINSTNDINSGWRRIELVEQGVYNILDIQGGIDALLATQEVPAGQISQIRFVLASNNSVVKNGTTYPLNVSLVILNVHENLQEGATNTIWIDFDAAKSIVDNGNNTYQFQPVMRAYNASNYGVVEGAVNASSNQTAVWAVLGQEKVQTYPSANGRFRIVGLQASASWKIVANNNNKSVEIDNVKVAAGQVTNIETIAIN